MIGGEFFCWVSNWQLVPTWLQLLSGYDRSSHSHQSAYCCDARASNPGSPQRRLVSGDNLADCEELPHLLRSRETQVMT